MDALFPEFFAQPLGGLRRCGDEVIGDAHREPLNEPRDVARPAKVFAPVLAVPHLVPGNGEALALDPGNERGA